MNEKVAADPVPSSCGPASTQASLLQAVRDSLTYPFCVVGATDYRVQLANQAARRMHQAGTATCHALIHHADQPCHGPERPCPLQLIRETGKPVVVEHIHPDDQGRSRTVEVHGFPVVDDQGGLTAIIEYCVDITEHKRMTEEHRWERAVDNALVELADALIDPSFSIEEVAETVLEHARRLTDSEHGYVSSVDPQTGENTGHTLTGMMGELCRVGPENQGIAFHPGPDGNFQSVHPDDRQAITASVNACMEQGKDYQIEHRIVWPDGTVRWVSETGNAVRDTEGKTIRRLGVVQDITEKKKAQIEIRKLNEQLEQRVVERTAEPTEANRQLRDEMLRRKRLEKEILEISEREQTVRQTGPRQRNVHGGSSLPDRPGSGLQRHSPRADQTDRYRAHLPPRAGYPVDRQ